MENTVVSIKNIDVKYDKSIILNNINLSIKKGEIIGLLGPSEAGKTTLVKAIIGMKSVDKGEIRVFDEVMPQLNISFNLCC